MRIEVRSFYRNNLDLSEGELSRLKEKLVDNHQLANFAKQWNLGKWILLGKGEELQERLSKRICCGSQNIRKNLYWQRK